MNVPHGPKASPIHIAATVSLWVIAFVFAVVFNLGSPSDAVISAERRYNRDADSVTVACCRIEGRQAYAFVRVIGPGEHYLEVPYEAKRLGGIWQVQRKLLQVGFARGEHLSALVGRELKARDTDKNPRYGPLTRAHWATLLAGDKGAEGVLARMTAAVLDGRMRGGAELEKEVVTELCRLVTALSQRGRIDNAFRRELLKTRLLRSCEEKALDHLMAEFFKDPDPVVHRRAFARFADRKSLPEGMLEQLEKHIIAGLDDNQLKPDEAMLQSFQELAPKASVTKLLQAMLRNPSAKEAAAFKLLETDPTHADAHEIVRDQFASQPLSRAMSQFVKLKEPARRKLHGELVTRCTGERPEIALSAARTLAKTKPLPLDVMRRLVTDESCVREIGSANELNALTGSREASLKLLRDVSLNHTDWLTLHHWLRLEKLVGGELSQERIGRLIQDAGRRGARDTGLLMSALTQIGVGLERLQGGMQESLKSEDVFEVRATLQLLRRFPPSRARCDLLIPLLGHSDNNVRFQALGMLKDKRSKLGPEQLPAVIAALAKVPTRMQREMYSLLTARAIVTADNRAELLKLIETSRGYGTGVFHIIPLIVGEAPLPEAGWKHYRRLLESDAIRNTIRLRMMTGLETLQPDVTERVAALIDLAGSRDDEVVTAAVVQLAALGRGARPALRTLKRLARERKTTTEDRPANLALVAQLEAAIQAIKGTR